MERLRRALATTIVGVLLLSVRASGTEEICQQVRLKPLHGVCGAVIDRSGAPVARAAVEILKDGTELVALQTGEDGKFSYDRLSAGNYDIQIQADGFRTFRFSIVMSKPDTRCKRALKVILTTGYPEICTNVYLVKR